MSSICPEFVLWARGRPWANGCFWKKSTLCPKSVHVLSLSNLCPISNFGISKAQNVNPEHFFPGPRYVQILSNAKNGTISNSSGQSLDQEWIFMSNLCPKDLELDAGLTEL